MGSKRELLPDIREEIDKVANEGDGVLDIFAGTGSVGLYLRDKYNVVSNDIQAYSSVICDAALIGASAQKKISFDTDSVLKTLKKYFNKNQKKLSEFFLKF